jgi:hypothetical protein
VNYVGGEVSDYVPYPLLQADRSGGVVAKPVTASLKRVREVKGVDSAGNTTGVCSTL